MAREPCNPRAFFHNILNPVKTQSHLKLRACRKRMLPCHIRKRTAMLTACIFFFFVFGWPLQEAISQCSVLVDLADMAYLYLHHMSRSLEGRSLALHPGLQAPHTNP